MLNTIKKSAFFALSFMLLPSANAAKFSNTSLDGQLGGDSVQGTFIDSTGGTGGAVEDASTKTISVIVAVCVFIGFVLSAKGIYDIYIVSKGNQSITYARAFITLLAGCALAILPVITFLTANSVKVFG